MKYESDMTTVEKWEQQWKTIKKLKGRKRWEYLWSYYKTVLVILGIVLFVVYIVATMVHNLTQETVLSIVLVDAVQQSPEKEKYLEKELERMLKLDQKEKVQIDTSAMSVDTDENMAKMTMVMSSVSGNDIVICGEETYKKYKDAGAFADIKQVLEEEYKDYIPYLNNGELDLQKSSNTLIREYITYSPVYVCILKNTEDIQMVKKFLSNIFLDKKC